ncbi:PREDICTED: amidase 1 [Tarenaya hassleriana]|uniref:amidase 1 n=1 Tax=Tarenaya hassleriana TaxID=28532 RepID=UPI00053C38AB|nr:PREDICTED: amidase 1 [Tarenaya hassleriana]
MATDNDFGAFMEKFIIPPTPSSSSPLQGLTFAIKDIFDVEGHVTGFGNPDWLRTHSAATSTAPVVSALLAAGATSVGSTVMDEMAYSINGENAHYGTPRNPIALDRVPGGSSSGSAVAVAAGLADFSVGTDTGGSVRVPASYCGVFGIRPSHGIVTTTGVVPMAQSFDTVGWFAREPAILRRVGCVLLQLPDLNDMKPSKMIIADDCFKLSSVPPDWMIRSIVRAAEKLFGGEIVKNVNLGDYIEEKVPSLKHFMTGDVVTSREFNIPLLEALSSSMRLLQRFEFKKNHGEWIESTKPVFGPGISERVEQAMQTTFEKIDACRSATVELRSALSDLLGDDGVLIIPTMPGPPPKLQTDASQLEIFRGRAFGLLSVAGVSGFCQVSIPLGLHENLPVSVSMVAKHGSDGLLLNLVEALWKDIGPQVCL